MRIGSFVLSREMGWPACAAVALVLLVQAALQSIFFPAAALRTTAPLYYIDSPYHHYQMEVARQLCSEGLTRGYDPLFAAGQPAGLAVNASAKLQAVGACISGESGAITRVYKQFTFWLGVLAPAALVLGALWLGLSPVNAFLAGGLGILLWWTGGLRWYHTAGMVSYVAAAFFAIPFAIATIRLVQRPNILWALGLSLWAIVGMALHPLFPIAAFLIGLPWLIAELRLPALGRSLVFLVAVAVPMVVVNGIWIFGSLAGQADSAYGLPFQMNVTPTLVIQEMLGLASTAGGGTRLGLALIVGSVLGIVFWRGPERRGLIGLVVGATLLMIWASVGALVPAIAALQPNRFSALAWLTLAIPTSAGWLVGAREVAQQSGVRRVALGLALAVPALLVAWFCRETWREFTAPPQAGRYAVAPPEVKGEGEISRAVEAYLAAHTDTSARVLFETSQGRVHDRAHMAGVFALNSGREFIGGPYPGTDFASAWDDFAFGKPIKHHTPAELAKLLDTYNVRWMICHRDACRHAMRALPDVRETSSFGPITTFERGQSPGWVVEGVAMVKERCINRLELDNVRGRRLVLRYHWVPGLRSVEGAIVEPIHMLEGARPFIAVKDPPAKLTLRIGDGAGVACAHRSLGPLTPRGAPIAVDAH